MTEEGKVCTGTCGKWKPYSDFHKDRTQKDGHKKICKSCRSVVQRTYQQKRNATSPKFSEKDRQAQMRAMRRLIDNHPDEYFNLVTRYRRELGIDPSWKPL